MESKKIQNHNSSTSCTFFGATDICFVLWVTYTLNFKVTVDRSLLLYQLVMVLRFICSATYTQHRDCWILASLTGHFTLIHFYQRSTELGADLATFHYCWPQCYRRRLSSFWNMFVSRHQCNWEPSALCQRVNRNSSLFNWDHCKREAGANGSLLCSPWGHDGIDGTIDHLWEGVEKRNKHSSPWWEWTLQGHHEILLLNILIPVILKSQTIGLETVNLENSADCYIR